MFTNFDSMFNQDWFDSFFGKASAFSNPFPPANIAFEDNDCHIELALSGYKKDDLKIEIVGRDVIKISADIEKEEDNRQYYTHRVKRESFSRSYKIPSDIYDVTKVKARMEDGVLYIVIPKREEKLIENTTIAIE